jgi:hypothetical protein
VPQNVGVVSSMIMIKIDNDKINDNAIIDTDKNKNNNK